MARKPRENVEDGVYHVYARGNARARVFYDDVDRRMYLRMLGKVVRQKEWRCLAFCLMNNHIHVLLETPKANLSSGMQSLQGRYAQFLNGRHRRIGHVFQGRYGSVRMASDGQVCAAAAYIARNPVDAGLREHPDEWPWSSFRGINGAPTPAWVDLDRLLSYFGTNRAEARQRYADMSSTAPVSLKGV